MIKLNIYRRPFGRHWARLCSSALMIAGIACAGEPACPEQEAMAKAFIEGINGLRAHPRSCGGEYFQAAAPLVWNDALAEAASNHAEDMADRGYFSHETPAGEGMKERLEKAGYAWSRLGENIAMGQSSVSAVLSSWTSSPGHCENMMQPGFVHAGLACTKSRGRLYWVLELGRPQD